MSLRHRLAILAAALALPFAAHAHKVWLLPSATVLGQDQWITVDAAVSNDLFYFNHVPFRLDNLVITAPDGSTAQAEGIATGKFRSVFDLHLAKNGTYRIAVVNNNLFAMWEENGQPKRWRGTADTFAKEVPAKADKLVVTHAQGRVESFVTAGNPNTTALAATGKGLELVPVTHPNDLFAGETANFKLQMDGKPASAFKITVIPGGTRYRDAQNEMALTTDAQGAFSVTWPEPGMYWLEVVHEDDKAAVAPATRRRASYVATFEVLAP